MYLRRLRLVRRHHFLFVRRIQILLLLAVRFCSIYRAVVGFELPPANQASFLLRAHCPHPSSSLAKKSPGLHPPPERGIKEQMEITLPLEKMTIAEKLRVMETLWNDLTRDKEQFESPEWHGEVLRERAARVKQGKESFVDWEAAKNQLRNRVK